MIELRFLFEKKKRDKDLNHYIKQANFLESCLTIILSTVTCLKKDYIDENIIADSTNAKVLRQKIRVKKTAQKLKRLERLVKK